MERRYYEAYDDRYRQVHGKKLSWFMEAPSAIVEETIQKFGIPKSANLLEIGCGEGRDAKYLLKQGFNLLATDISPEAISYCQRRNPEFSTRFQVLDCINQRLDTKFDFIYAVAVVHMLVQDIDRNAFYQFVREQLSDNGVALICTMGDGELERCSDLSTAFDLQKRIHEQTGTTLYIAGTSYRAVSFPTFERELDENGFEIIKQGFTDMRPDYFEMMYAVVKRKS